MTHIPGTVPLNMIGDKKVNGANLYAWDDPLPIKKELPPVEDLPLNTVPDAFHTWIADISERMQVAPDAVAAAAIVMVSSVIGAGCGVRPKQNDDWLVIPNLWGAIVSPPSTLKSPAMHQAFKPLRKIEAQAKRDYDQALSNYEYEVEHEATKPIKPTWRRYRTNDATIEKCSELLAVNPRGILVERDELTGLLSTWDRTGREADRSFYLEAWNGYGFHTVDRINRGMVHVDKLCLSIFGGTQPEKLASYFYQTNGNQNDGLFQRLQLAVYPDHPTDWKVVDRQPNYAAANRVFEIIQKLIETDFIELGASTDEYEPTPYFHFDDESQQLFYEWWEELQNHKLIADESPIIIEHFAKYRSLVPSLALIFHLIEIASGNEPGSITVSSLRRALAYTEYLESHARRIYSLGSGQAFNHASELAKKIKQGKLSNQFTLRDVYRKNWHLLATKVDVQSACDELQEMDWLQCHVIERSYRQPSKTVYMINPKVGHCNG